ncbi:acyl dehydratase [Roseomonas terrae]|uniref:Acyl dehydratase n=2 Tax=Neoroseomonas terrae TaxID=424799 RepID=A0ABS5ER93_9PROT|nr:acyl dehydratase [Neoroseomonas terrae]
MTVDRSAILAYAGITDDFNPIHVDPVFAATTSFGRPIAHGMLSLNLIWQALRAGPGLTDGVELEVRFKRPVAEGMVIYAGCCRAERGDVFDVWVRDQDGDQLITGSARPRTFRTHGEVGAAGPLLPA